VLFRRPAVSVPAMGHILCKLSAKRRSDVLDRKARSLVSPTRFFCDSLVSPFLNSYRAVPVSKLCAGTERSHREPPEFAPLHPLRFSSPALLWCYSSRFLLSCPFSIIQYPNGLDYEGFQFTTFCLSRLPFPGLARARYAIHHRERSPSCFPLSLDAPRDKLLLNMPFLALKL